MFERLGPRLRRNAGNGGPGRFGRLFDSAVRGIRVDATRGRQWSPIRRGRQASPLNVRLQSQPPSPRFGEDGAGPSNTAPRNVEAPEPPVVEEPPALEEPPATSPVYVPRTLIRTAPAPMPPVDEVAATPAYVPMEPMSPSSVLRPFWCDFCKEYTTTPHTLEYGNGMLSPITASPAATVAPPLDPWFLQTRAAPALDAVKEEEDDVPPGFTIADPFNTAARTGISPYFFLDRAGPSAPPPATAPLPPSRTRAEVAARMKAQALSAPAPASTMTEGTATTPPTLRRLLGRSVAAPDRRPGLRRGTWNVEALGLPFAEMPNHGGGGFSSPDEGECSHN